MSDSSTIPGVLRAAAAWATKRIVPEATVSEPIVEAKFKPPPVDEMVPIYHWTKKHVWVFVKGPGAVPLPVKIPHSLVKKSYKDKLTTPGGEWELLGMIHPATYKGPKSIYPINWEPEHGKPKAPPDPAAHHAVAKAPDSPEGTPPDMHALDDLPAHAPAHFEPWGPPVEDGWIEGSFYGHDARLSPDGTHLVDMQSKEVLWGHKPGDKSATTIGGESPAKPVQVKKPAAEPKAQVKLKTLGDFDLPQEWSAANEHPQFKPSVNLWKQSGYAMPADTPWYRGTWAGFNAVMFYGGGDPYIDISVDAGTANKYDTMWSASQGTTDAGKGALEKVPEEPPKKWSKYNLPEGAKLVDSHATKHGGWKITMPGLPKSNLFVMATGDLVYYDVHTGTYHSLMQVNGEWKIDWESLVPLDTVKSAALAGWADDDDEPTHPPPLKGWTAAFPEGTYDTPEGTHIEWNAEKNAWVYWETDTVYQLSQAQAQDGTSQPDWIPAGWKLVGDDANDFPHMQAAGGGPKVSMLDQGAKVYGIWTGSKYQLFDLKNGKFASSGKKISAAQAKKKQWDQPSKAAQKIKAAGFNVASGASKNAYDDGIPETWQPNGEEDVHDNPQIVYTVPQDASTAPPVTLLSIMADGAMKGAFGSIGDYVAGGPAYYGYEFDELGVPHATGDYWPAVLTTPETTAKGVDLPEGWEHWAATDPNGFDMAHSDMMDDEVSILPHEFNGTRFGWWNDESKQYDLVTLVDDGTWVQLSDDPHEVTAEQAATGHAETPDKAPESTYDPDGKAPQPQPSNPPGPHWESEGIDINGYPEWLFVPQDESLTLLADGKLYDWYYSDEEYYEVEWDGFKFEVNHSKAVTLEGANAMHGTPVPEEPKPVPAKSGKTPPPIPPGIEGEWEDYGVDENALPKWMFHYHGDFWILTALPNGKFARWSNMYEKYKVKVWDSEKDAWAYPHPPVSYTLDQVKAMSGGGAAEDMPGTAEFIPKGWTALPEKNLHGFTQITHPTYAKSVTAPRVILPGVSPKYYGKWQKTAKVYRLYTIKSTGTQYSIKNPQKTMTHAEVLAAGQVAKPPENSTHDQMWDQVNFADGSFSWMPAYDVNGFPTVKGTGIPSGAHIPISTNPSQLVMWQGVHSGYVTYEWNTTYGGWSQISAPLWSKEEILKKLETYWPAAASKSKVQQATQDIEVPVAQVLSTPKATPAVELPPSEALADLASKLPKPSELTIVHKGEGMKGAGVKYVYKDKKGDEYLFKPAWPKSGKQVEAFRASAQELFATLANQVTDHIPVKTMTIDGVVGTLQPMIELGDPPDLAGQSPSDLTPSELNDVITEHVVDWINSQHDSHRGNLIRTKDGRIRSIDKEQGFKYFGKDQLSTEYHPNSVYGEQEPFYNTVWRDFAEGKVDFDPMHLKGAFEKLHTSDFDEAGLRNYAAVNPFIEGYAEEEFVGKARSRKNTAKRDFEKFITKQYQKREGKEGTFTFKKGWEPVGGAAGDGKVYAEKVYDLASLSEQMGKTSIEVFVGKTPVSIGVREFSKEHGALEDRPDQLVFKVPSSVGLEKLKGVLVLFGVRMQGDPVQGSVNLMVFVKRSDLKRVGSVTQRYEVTQETQAYVPHSGVAEYLPTAEVYSGAAPNLEVLADVEAVPDKGVAGKRVFFDGEWVTGQTGMFRRAKVKDAVFTQVQFRLNRLKLASLQLKGTSGQYSALTGTYSAKHDAIDQTGGIPTKQSYMNGKSVTIGKDSLFVCQGSSSNYALKGYVFADIHSSDVMGTLKALLTKMVGATKATLIMKPATEHDRAVTKARKLLSAYKPQRHDSLMHSNASGEQFMAEIKKAGLTDKLASMQEVDGVEGVMMHSVPGRWKEAVDSSGVPLLRFCVHGTGDPSAVPAVLANGLAGSVQRAILGTTKDGAVNGTDYNTGGADTAGIRTVTKNTMDGGMQSFGGVGGAAGIVYVFSPDIVDRIDAVMHDGDSYQVTHGGTHNEAWTGRKPMAKKIQSNDNQGGNGKSGHEIIFIRGLHPKKILRIACSNETNRNTVISACQQAGVEEHNGVPIEDFVVVETSRAQVYNKYVKPAGF